MDKMYSRRRISMLAAGGATLVAVRPGLAFGRQEDATPAAGGVGSLADLQGRVFSKGPNGEEPTAAEEVSLTEEELEQIRGMGATAAIVMHYGGNDWAVAQIAGLKDQFGKMGIEVIAETDAGFDPATQVSDIETTLARNPSIIVSIPTDPVATATAYRQAAEQGVQLVFMDNVPQGFTAGEDFVSIVSADNYGNGVASALIMGEALGGEGRVGVVFHAADFFVTRQRYDAFLATMAEQFPNIEIVAEQGIAGPDFAGQADQVASAMLTQNPDLNGIWAVWDVPAEGVINAVRTAGRAEDVVVTTIDLGQNVAVALAQGEIIRGLGAQRPFDQGVAEAMLAGYGLLGKEAPAYVALPALPVTQENVLEAWTQVYHQDPPPALAEAAG